jgi:2-aminoethylphosphonate-pyruvate transaminase
VAPNVCHALLRHDICHREHDFRHLLRGVESKLLRIFNIKNIRDYSAVIITGSGTAANEAMLSSAVGNKRILILSNGEFGDRLFDISSIHNANTFIMRFPWGEAFDLDKVSAYLKSSHIDVICIAHHETSSGMINPLEAIGLLARSCGAIFMVDCVSSAGAEEIHMERNNISFCTGSSSKAIESHPGLSFVIGKKTSFEEIKYFPIKTAYLNLYRFYDLMNAASETPNTPAVHLIYSLDQALLNIIDEGFLSHYNKLKDRALKLRKGMLDLGLTFLIDQSSMSSMLTTVNIPSHINPDLFHNKIYEKSIVIYKGKGCFKDKVFQVGHIGNLSFEDIDYFLLTLKNVLKCFDLKLIGECCLKKSKEPKAPNLQMTHDKPHFIAQKVFKGCL